MSASSIITLGYGSGGTPSLIIALGFGIGAADAAVAADTHDGGGADWYRAYTHPSDHKRKKPDEVREMYEAMVEVAPVAELAKIQAVVAEYVDKSAINSNTASRLAIPPPKIDWVALAKDIEQVYALARIYQRMMDEDDDDAFFILM